MLFYGLIFMDRKTKRWGIIIIDLAIVFGFYFAYTYFRGPLTDTNKPAEEFKTQVIHQKIKYNLRGRLENTKQINMTFRVENKSNNSQTIQLPNGITLMLTDAEKDVYKNKIMKSTSLELTGKESRSWKRTFSTPEKIKKNLMAGFFIDGKRQKLVQVPR